MTIDFSSKEREHEIGKPFTQIHPLSSLHDGRERVNINQFQFKKTIRKR